jgi:beta-glucosidase
MKTFLFPEGFELGVASAATQVDGDCKNSNWYDWYLNGHIKDSSNPDIATRHREFLEEDTALMASMGIRHYRFGLEWARIEPEEGVFSDEEFEKVREELELLRKSNISVLLTIHHFSNPLWFEKSGGFLRRDCVDIFLRLCEKVVENLGDLVSEYITINEPNVYAVNGYMTGVFPPGETCLLKTLRIIENMGKCHREAYKLIHHKRYQMGCSDTKVSFAHHMRSFAPLDEKNPLHRLAARVSEYYFQTQLQKSYLLGTGRDWGCFADFLALNYYSRTASSGLADGVFPGTPINDLGWEIYPEGIVECARKLHELCPELPIYITENGTADNNDLFRRRYLYEHIKALCFSSLPVTRYYHWCFVDNFEWCEGFSARFGLVWLDTETMERKIKKSGEFFTQMIAEKGVTEEMAEAALRKEYRVG